MSLQFVVPNSIDQKPFAFEARWDRRWPILQCLTFPIARCSPYRCEFCYCETKLPRHWYLPRAHDITWSLPCCHRRCDCCERPATIPVAGLRSTVQMVTSTWIWQAVKMLREEHARYSSYLDPRCPSEIHHASRSSNVRSMLDKKHSANDQFL